MNVKKHKAIVFVLALIAVSLIPAVGQNPGGSIQVGLKTTLSGFWATESNSIAFSPDGRKLVAIDNKKMAGYRIWDVESGKEIRSWKEEWKSHSGSFQSVALSPDGSMIAAGYQRIQEDDDNSVKIFDAGSGAELRTLPNGKVENYGLAFSPDGSMLAAEGCVQNVDGACPQPLITLYDTRTWEVLRNLQGHKAWIFAVAFSPNGSVLASGAWDSTIRLWEVASGRLLTTLKGHSSSIHSVAFSPNGRFLASAGHDRVVKIWDVAGKKLVKTLESDPNWTQAVAFSHDGRFLASCSCDRPLPGPCEHGTVRIYDAATWSQLELITLDSLKNAQSLAFSPTKNILAVAGFTVKGAPGAVELWDIR